MDVDGSDHKATESTDVPSDPTTEVKTEEIEVVAVGGLRAE